MAKRKKVIAFIPARQGSIRLKNKNILKLCKHPLIAYAIVSAVNSKIFDKIIVSTDSPRYAKIANYYGAEVNHLRPKKISTSLSSDYQWINHEVELLKKKGMSFTHFFILRPTSPFRTKKTIIRAWKLFLKIKKTDSLRALEMSKLHPGKMWVIKKNYMIPLIKRKIKNQPYFNSQFASLPPFYVQNACLEISKMQVLEKYKTITGKKIIPFFTKKHEGFDINYPNDITRAKTLVKKNKKLLEIIKKKPYKISL